MLLTNVALATTITMLSVEAIKKMTDSDKRKLHLNVITAICSIIIGVGICVGDTIINGGGIFTKEIVVNATTTVFLTWISSMVGYDKVREALSGATRGGTSK